jgi:uroporphyrin-III C-methyltransferase
MLRNMILAKVFNSTAVYIRLRETTECPEARDDMDLAGMDLPDIAPGTVWLVGAGPGDPGLITIYAAHGLAHAEVIVYDALVDRQILDLANRDADLIFAGKRGGRPSPSQDDISQQLVALARAGRRVLRLKGGDPCVFGRGGEEALALAQAGIPFRLVPGITAGIGGLAYAGIPATHRDTNAAITFITGHTSGGDVPKALDWAALAKGSPTLVLYMALRHLDRIAALLMEAGRNPQEPVAIITSATTPGQRTLFTTLETADADAKAAAMAPPALVVIGENVAFHQQLDWFQALGAGN